MNFSDHLLSLWFLRVWSDPEKMLQNTSMKLEVSSELIAHDAVMSKPTKLTNIQESPGDIATSTSLLFLGHGLFVNLPTNSTAPFFTIENFAARQVQAGILANKLASARSSQPCDNHWEVLYLLRETFEALKGSMSGDVVDELLQMCQQPQSLSGALQQRFIDLCRTCSDKVFLKLIDPVLTPLLDVLHHSWSIERSPRRSGDRGLGDVYLGLLRFHLLLPRSVLDPGRKPAVKVDLMERQVASTETQIAAEALYEIMNTGISAPCFSHFERVGRLNGKILKQKAKIIVRSERRAPFSDLHREFHGFGKDFLDERKIKELAEGLSSGENHEFARARVLSLLDSWNAFSERSLQLFCQYEDIVLPLVGAVSLVARGMMVLLRCVPENIEWDLTYALQVCFSYPQKDYFSRPIMLTKFSPSVRPRQQWSCFLSLAFAELFRVLIARKTQGMGKFTVQSWSQIVESVLSLADLQKVGVTTDAFSARTDEDIAEEKFRAVFPDHRKDFSLNRDIVVENGVPDEEESPQSCSPSLSRNDCELMAWIHTKMFSSAVVSVEDRIKAFHFCYRAGGEIFSSRFFDRSAVCPEQFGGAHVLAISLSTPMCSFRSTGLKVESVPGEFEDDFQFYPNPEGASKLAGPMERLMGRVIKLLALFPGNAVLVSLFKVADRVRKLDALHTSSAAMLAGLEELLKHAQDWEQHASIRVQIGDSLVEIRKLVADLRKLELQSWPSLLVSLEKSYGRKARRHWIRLHVIFHEFLSNIRGVVGQPSFVVAASIPRWVSKGLSPTENNKLFQTIIPCSEGFGELVKTLDTFILTSPLAETLPRLQILHSFGVQFKEESHTQVSNTFSAALLSRTILSLCEYYDQFSTFLCSSLAQMRRPFEERLKKEVKLAKWDLQSYYALADTADRNHRKLMGILNEYDEVLQTTANLLLEKEQDRGIKNRADSADASVPDVPPANVVFPLAAKEENLIFEVRDIRVPDSSEWRLRKSDAGAVDKRIDRIPHYAGRMAILMGKIESDAVALRGTSETESISAAVFDRIGALRRKNTTRAMKERGLVDLYRELKRQGYSHMNLAVPEEFRKFGEILHLPSPLSHLDETSTRFKYVQGCEDYYFRCLVELNRIRPESTMNGCGDFTQRQVLMMLGYANHSLFLVVQQRSVIASVLHNIDKLSRLLRCLHFSGAQLVAQADCTSKRAADFERVFAGSTEGIRQFSILVEASKHLMDEHKCQELASRLIAELTDWLGDVSSNSQSNSDHALITTALLLQIQSSRTKLCHARDIIEKSRSALTETGCLPDSCFGNCLEEINKAIAVADACTSQTKLFNSDRQKCVSHKFQRLCTDTIESALLRAQECSETDVNSELIWACHTRASTQLLNLQITRLITSCEAMVQELEEIIALDGVGQDNLAFCSSLSADVSLLCQQTMKLINRRLDQYISFYRSCAKFSYILLRVFRTLIARGFCSDKVEEEGAKREGEGSMSFTEDNDGTGMGEGEGRQDVTDEIENEEQLLGTKTDNTDLDNQKHEGSKELEEDEAEKGMEMENDFDGEVYDVPAKQEDQEDGEEDEEELDREMGDGPGENEQVVDEKMWDGDDDDDKMDRTEDEKIEEGDAVKGQRLGDEMVSKDDKGECEQERDNLDERAPEDGFDQNQLDETNSQQDMINDDDENMVENAHGVEVRDERDDEPAEDDKEMELDDDLNLENDGDDSENKNDGMEEQQEDSLREHEEPDETMVGNEEELENEEEECSPQRESATNVGGTDEDDLNETEERDEDENDGHFGNISHHKETSNSGLGIRSAEGNDQVDDQVDSEEEGGQANDCSHESSDDHNRESSGQGGSRSTSQPASNISHGSQADVETKVSDRMPNPFHNLGDAEKFWHQRLNVVQSDDKMEDVDDMNPDYRDLDEEGRGDYEYSKENEKGTTQALGEIENDVKPEEIDRDAQLVERKEQNTSGNRKEMDKTDAAKYSRRSQSKLETPPGKMEVGDDDVKTEDLNKADEEDITGGGEDDNPTEKTVGRAVSDLSKLYVADGWADRGTGETSIVQDDDILQMSDVQHDEARARWGTIQRETYPLARRLCEKLRLVMEPLVASKLRGDYRTGKRINMKRVIGYIASGYRKDKIWLRRTKPAKRNYRVLVAVDDSESMKKTGTGEMALRAMATLTTGMSQLEIGEIGIASFGDEMRLLHPFNQPFTSESGVKVTSCFQFKQQRTRTALCVESAMMALDDSYRDVASMQIVFMISDGRIERDSRATLRRLIREMMEKNILMAMIIVESHENGKDSIVNMKEVTFVDGKPRVKAFMEDYPFPYYIVLDDMTNLPVVLGDALRQWFELLARLQTSNL